ncbi:hypothetical protein K435DRAFT_228037 [Dendrothele bispora CBS 962.96]|uniref:Ribonuclease H1 N-terminal domain-containing protein n=1 Tax=Dendrothele bispora (strain CBS 962.96) TaxID=1314807 RepID=A0A4S8LQM8_DENBC|nr:hypothetical protein K435DRAFT_228037 [Dendrothele bispora CBS 962.96]
MPKASKAKFYAVSIGKQGPKIYTTWEECKANTSRYPGAKHKSFYTRQEADEWLGISQFEPPQC